MNRFLGSALVLAAAAAISCGPPPENAGRRIRPHLNPIYFGDMEELPNGEEPDPTTGTYPPFAWTLQLQSWGTEPVTISDDCAVGDTEAFTYEYEPNASMTIDPGAELLVRITYTRTKPRGDGNPDHVSFVFQSDADDYPTLVVTACGRTIPSGQMPDNSWLCEPQADPAQQPDRSLCGG